MQPARVLVIYTGGTIGMVRRDAGYVPAKGLLSEQLRRMPQFHDDRYPAYTTPTNAFGKRVWFDVQEYDELLDSSDIAPGHWNSICRDIHGAYEDYDGFVVLHGTDTLAFTAAALSFALGSLSKPIILTGAQLPIGEARTDAISNLVGAVELAGLFPIPEVCVYFDGHLMRGCRTLKWDSVGTHPFQSPNYPLLATVGLAIDVNWKNILAPSRARLTFTPYRDDISVVCLRVTPGLSPEVIAALASARVDGLVLETYGTGNAPTTDPAIIDALSLASDGGMVVVNVSQCSKGTVSPTYATGRALDEAGVVSGGDMTAQAACVKVMHLLSQPGTTPEAVRLSMLESLRGEMSERPIGSFGLRGSGLVTDTSERLKVQGVAGVNEASVAHSLAPYIACMAAKDNDLDTLRHLFLRDGFSPSLADHRGRTPLHVAAAFGQVEACRLLVALGADPDAQDDMGRTPRAEASLKFGRSVFGAEQDKEDAP